MINCRLRCVSRVCAIAMLVLTGSSGHAQKPAAPAAAQFPVSAPGIHALAISVPQPGEYYVRVLPSADALKPAQLPTGFKETTYTYTYTTAEIGRKAQLAIDDAHTGNTAILPRSGRITPDGKSVTLSQLDFDHVRQVKALVTYQGHSVAAARVSLTGTDKSAKAVTVDPAAQGIAVFDDVPIGKANLRVFYGDQLTDTRDVEITGNNSGGYLAIPVILSNRVATLDGQPPTLNGIQPPSTGSAGAAASAQLKQAQPEPSAAPQGGGFASLVGTVIGLAIAGGGIWLLYKWAQSGGMAATLGKAGIQVAGPPVPSASGTPWAGAATTAPVVTDPTVCEFCGHKKDAAGNCACTLSTGAGGAGVQLPGLAGTAPQPRLVGTVGLYSGTVFPLELNGAGATVGREATCGVPLPNDTTVSRRHALISAQNGAYSVHDEGSSNGIYVNGVRINGAGVITPGDEVQIGNTRFRFEL